MNARPWLGRSLRFGLMPFALYLVCFAIVTFPMIGRFSSEYFCDGGDGAQMLWDVWWVREALLVRHQLPWHTDLLYHPIGASLWLHSLTPFNGLLAIPLSCALTDVQTYNVLVLLAFVGSATTAFWLAHAVTRAYVPSLIAGYVFAFCSYRFAHASGHLTTISTELVPLFLMLWLRFLSRPKPWLAIVSAFTLFAILLCDHYLFLFSAVAAAIAFTFAWSGFAKWKEKGNAIPLAAFAVTGLALIGPLVVAMLYAAYRDAPLYGAHASWKYSADLLSPFVPARTWIYRTLTRPLWLPIGNYEETSVYVGLAPLAAAVVGAMRGRRVGVASIQVWLTIGLVFLVMSFGPRLTVRGEAVFEWMPYRLLEIVVPPLRLSGCPARMMIMTQLAVAVLAATGLKWASSRLKTRAAVAATGSLFVAVMIVESMPAVLPTFRPDVPAWVTALRDAPDPEAAVFDSIEAGHGRGMYYQTIHRRPMAGGVVARVNEKVYWDAVARFEAVGVGQIDERLPKEFGYLVVGASQSPLPFEVYYADRAAVIYRLDHPRP